MAQPAAPSAVRRYDPELTYTLRPGRFRFRAREFDNLFEVNSRGLRDDEESLAGPEIIVLGDSHAMGWGVEQKDTFASRLAAATGRRVLNAGIPSYGTARELGLLARLDTSRLTVLVVQYCSNDYRENRAWVDGGGALEIKGAAEYEQLSRGHREAVAYRFGKHVLGLARVLLERLRDGEEAIRFPPLDDPGPENEAAVFADVLASSAVDLSGVRIVVLELNANAANDRLFLDRLQAELARDDLPASVRNLVTVDVSDALDAGHYYVLDSHMTPAGHDVVAELLVHVLEN